SAPASCASAQPSPQRSRPRAPSIDQRPGPVAVIAKTLAIRTPLYSQPPSVFQTPLLAWTRRIAVAIVLDVSSAPSGVRKPVASSAPPPASASPAAVA